MWTVEDEIEAMIVAEDEAGLTCEVVCPSCGDLVPETASEATGECILCGAWWIGAV